MCRFFKDVGFHLLFGIELALALSLPRAAEAQEDPYFVTDHYHLPDAGEACTTKRRGAGPMKWNG